MSYYVREEDGTSKYLLEDGSGAYLEEGLQVDVPFIGSVTVVYTPTFGSTQTATLPFIASATVVDAPTLHRSAHFVGSTVASAASGTSFTGVSVPGGVADGDLMLAVFSDAAGGTIHATCAGWTEIAATTNICVLARIASSEPSSYTFAGGTFRCAGIMVYRGPLSATPDASGVSTSSAVGVTLTPTSAEDLEIHIVESADPTGLTAAPAFTVRASVDYFATTGLWIEDRLDYPSNAATGTITPGGSTGTSPHNVHLLFRTTLNEVDPGFIASTTTVYTLALQGTVDVPFISSHTTLYALQLPYLYLPFIASKTRVYGVFSVFTDIFGTGPGNGGETTLVRLAPNGTSVSAALAAALTDTGSLLELSGYGGLPTTEPFVLTIGDEQLYVVAIGSGAFRIRGRGLGNTTAAAHSSGASATWGDSYDMAIRAGSNIDASFTADINSSGSHTYPGWLICFDSSQAYLAGDRYPMHATEVVGVFDAGAGAIGLNRLDASQPNAICTAAAVSDDCPAALSNPARIETDIVAGDVAVVRFTNPEASALDLGPRSVALQSWFGMKRVDDTDNDVTLTDPTGHVVDTNPGVGDFTGSVNGEWDPPVSGPGISPSTGLPTSHDVPFTSVTLPAADRYFTNPASGYAEKGWPICCLAVRQENRRIPHWESWDWHDFNYVYCGFGTDDTYAQLLVNRNGMSFGGSDPSVELPGSQDIDGPNAVWDDGSYFFGASWYVALWQGPYLVLGPSIGGTGSPGLDSGPMPVVDFPPGGSPVVFTPADSGPPPVEGGSGGGIPIPGGGHEVFQVSIV